MKQPNHLYVVRCFPDKFKTWMAFCKYSENYIRNRVHTVAMLLLWCGSFRREHSILYWFKCCHRVIGEEIPYAAPGHKHKNKFHNRLLRALSFCCAVLSSPYAAPSIQPDIERLICQHVPDEQTNIQLKPEVYIHCVKRHKNYFFLTVWIQSD